MKKIKKKDLTYTFFRDMWLKKYHNTTSAEVAKKHPDLANTPDWFLLYPCTQEQADEWEAEAKEIMKKHFGTRGEREWVWAWLDVAPYVPREE